MANWLGLLAKSWKEDRWIVVCLVGVLLLRIPSLFEPYWYGDEGIYLAIGAAIRKGLLLYRDIYDNKPPLLYLMAAAAGSVAWFRAILLVWMLITITFFWMLLNRLFGTNQKLVKIASGLLALLTSLPVIEGNIANSEIFMIGLTIIAFWLVYPLLAAVKKRQKRGDWMQLTGSGLLLGTAFLLKVPALFDFMALAGFMFLSIDKKNIKTTMVNMVMIGVGFVLPVAVSLVYFVLQGIGGDYIRITIAQNLGYVSSWKAGNISGGSFRDKLGLLGRGGMLLVFYGGLFWNRKKISKAALLTFCWFGFALFAALLSERPYAHYLIQLLPPLAILIGLLTASQKRLSKLVSLVLIICLVAAGVMIRFWYYPVVSYYANFIAYASGAKSQADYLANFSGQVRTTYAAGNYLAGETEDGEKIFIWGDHPYLYALSKTLPAGRFTVAYHIIDFRGQEETIAALRAQPSRLIVVDKNEKRPFEELFPFLEENYQLENEFDYLAVYRLRGEE